MADITKKVDKLLQYIILVAGQEDDYFDRQLGPIHLIKYLYLADLSYAERHNGQTYTGLPWRFHHYGPWAVEAFQRIEPALSAIFAEKRVIESTKYEDDFTRWAKRDDEICDKIYNELPISVTGTIAKSVHKFGKDTPSLLDHCYRTPPMLKAAPGDNLDFTIAIDTAESTSLGNDNVCDFLTKRQEKKRSAQLSELKLRLRKKIEERKRESKLSYTKPRYDEIFFEGLKHLDSLAGSKIPEGKYVAEFSDDIWKSKTRFDPDLS